MSENIVPKISYFSSASSAEQIEDRAKVDIFEQAALYRLEELHLRYDPASGLKAIIAMHSTSRGPALGGTRCLAYPTADCAIHDAMRLARGMSYKSAFAGLPYGGGKGVLIRPKQIRNPDAYFESYGSFINSLSGRFITAVDVGTRVEDMDRIARRTQYVLSTSAGHGDPSFYTATGVFRGILAAAKVRFKRQDLERLHIAIQGVGKVGLALAKLLHQSGAALTISDIDDQAAQRCTDEFGAVRADKEKIYQLKCDIFSPCALGGIINDDTINRIKARVICGGANNQLATELHGDILYRKKIFYVPDYVVNAGGLIHVVRGDSAQSRAAIEAIYDAVTDIYQRSKSTQEPSHRVANRIAEQLLFDSNGGKI